MNTNEASLYHSRQRKIRSLSCREIHFHTFRGRGNRNKCPPVVPGRLLLDTAWWLTDRLKELQHLFPGHELRLSFIGNNIPATLTNKIFKRDSVKIFLCMSLYHEAEFAEEFSMPDLIIGMLTCVSTRWCSMPTGFNAGLYAFSSWRSTVEKIIVDILLLAMLHWWCLVGPFSCHELQCSSLTTAGTAHGWVLRRWPTVACYGQTVSRRSRRYQLIRLGLRSGCMGTERILPCSATLLYTRFRRLGGWTWNRVFYLVFSCVSVVMVAVVFLVGQISLVWDWSGMWYGLNMSIIHSYNQIITLLLESTDKVG